MAVDHRLHDTESLRLPMLFKTTLPLRFWSKVHALPNGCWSWTAYRSHGYGQFRWQGHIIRAHRLCYEMLISPIPINLECDHLCRNRACVNPKHIEIVTYRVNMLRGFGFGGINTRKTHCLRGHSLTGANLYVRPKGRRRECRICRFQTTAAYLSRIPREIQRKRWREAKRRLGSGTP